MATLDELLAQIRQYEESFNDDVARIDDFGGANASGLLATIKNTYTSRKTGHVAALMNRLPELPTDARKAFGRAVNLFKARVESTIAEREAALAAARRPPGAVDVTLPGRTPQLGFRHPLSLVKDELITIF